MSKKELILFCIFAIGVIAILIYLRATNQIDTAQLINLFVTSILVIITAIYVKRTAEIANATKEQTKATMKMAEEMRNDKSPYITIQWGGGNIKTKNISAHIKNDGFGPALNLKCYLTHKTFTFKDKNITNVIFTVGQDYPLSIDSEDFDFKEWGGLSINCDYTSILGDKFRSILMCESQDNRSFQIIKLNSGDRND